MQRSSFLQLLVATLIALPFAGAKDVPPTVVTHVAEAKKSETSLRFAEELHLVLPAPTNGGPDSEWLITSNDPRILRLSGGPKAATAADLAAAAEKTGAPLAPGARTVTFLALRPGRSVVRLACVRPAQHGEATSLATREINVVVNER